MQQEPPTTDRETELQKDQHRDQQRVQQSQDSATIGQSPNQQDHSQQPALTTEGATSTSRPLNSQPPEELTSADSAPGDVQQKQQFQVPEQPDPQADPVNHPGESTAMPGQDYAQAGTPNLDGKTEGTLLDDTMQELQLRSQPFTGSSAEGELFADEVTFSQINEIKQAIIKGDTVLVLTGEEGAGKTTLLKQLTRNSGTRLQFFSVKGGEKYTTHNLFSGILNAWKLNPPADFEDSTNEMLRALQANQERHTTVVLLLDDADLIPPKELHLLLATVQYFNGDEQLLRVILSVQPQFEAQLPQLLPQGLKLPYSAMQVEPMLASRAAPYIQLRLNQAGHFDEFPLSDKQVSAIANDASGYPGRINFLAAEALNDMFFPFTDSQSGSTKSGFFSKFSKAGSSGSRATGGIGKIAKVAAALFGVGLIVAGIYSTTLKDKSGGEDSVANNESGNSEATGNNTAATGSAAEKNSDFKTVETRPVVPKPANAANENVADATASGSTAKLEQVSAAGASSAASNDTLAEDPEAAAISAADSTANTGNQSNNTSAVTQQDQTGTAEAELRAAASELSVALGKPTNSSSSTATATGSAASPETNSVTNRSAESLESAEPAATPVAESSSTAADSTNAESAAEPANEATAEADQEAASAVIGDTTDSDAELPAASPSGASSEQTTAATGTETSTDEVAATSDKTDGDNVNGLESPNWVLLQNADLFTIQMSASTDRSDITRFLRAADLQKPTSIYSFKRGETTWYALVQGLYPDLGEARTAIKGMNKAAVKNQPWIRKIGSIQNSLKNQ